MCKKSRVFNFGEKSNQFDLKTFVTKMTNNKTLLCLDPTLLHIYQELKDPYF